MKNLIPDDYTRCVNVECDKRENCKRFLQSELDKMNPENKPLSFCLFKSENCEKIIKLI